jgi:hypothetical protein
MKNEFDKNWPLEFDEIWVPLLQTDGQWDYEKIKNEMHDLVFSLKQVSIVYSELTNGKLSKPLYYADTIIDINNDEMQKSYENGYNDAMEYMKGER